LTSEQLTRNLYNYLIASSRIDNMPMGHRPASFDELARNEPRQADNWRLGVRAFLDAIGATNDDDDHLNFTGSPLPVAPPPELVKGDEGEEHRITEDGG
jgi:hypothetical protein